MAIAISSIVMVAMLMRALSGDVTDNLVMINVAEDTIWYDQRQQTECQQ